MFEIGRGIFAAWSGHFTSEGAPQCYGLELPHHFLPFVNVWVIDPPPPPFKTYSSIDILHPEDYPCKIFAKSK